MYVSESSQKLLKSPKGYFNASKLRIPQNNSALIKNFYRSIKQIQNREDVEASPAEIEEGNRLPKVLKKAKSASQQLLQKQKSSDSEELKVIRLHFGDKPKNSGNAESMAKHKDSKASVNKSISKLSIEKSPPKRKRSKYIIDSKDEYVKGVGGSVLRAF